MTKENLQCDKYDKRSPTLNGNNSSNNNIVSNNYVENINTKNNDDGENDVQKCFASLNSTIEDMNIQFNNILKDNEEKYILAFNTYMYDVQKEIGVLKKIVKEEKIKKLKDEKMKKLQKELKWYINECLRLDKISEYLKKEADKWKRNSELMKSHMLFLERKLYKIYEKIIYKENIKKENDIIKDDKIIKIKKSESEIHLIKKEICNERKDIKQLFSDIKKNDDEKNIKKDETYKQIDLKITNLEKKLKKQININSSLQQKLANYYIEKSKYEKLFIECVQQIKRDLTKRTLRKDKEQYVQHNFSSLLNKSEFNNFTNDEKKNILISFFSTNDIIYFMNKYVFSKEKLPIYNNTENSYSRSTIKYQKRSDISPFIL
ncbi:conserved Plasmodium protein, unknown function [Plasmodium gaboni]|uniref:Growth arrest-specific protein 8 domain-containing protein n=1 Tax=Plasmodium gaboni TaxID=647221 RepID=A0ABY1UKA6_9APIC|nr:conserved Plasmodium protein, unknown function [Plasmodium gaboni]